ncbi:Ribulose bisphosphate carboxylase small chain, chloroplastic [Morella rubra]|uniref:Ribulose bisphosphate carboxylase small subunit n=1 Tax=Morella rubra TaxID=262757 RepID=A0A6A1W837_9ROSI|nr:Ribulose bisphosphate carboxylase small chain, chloroplastic [Morella rubra]
MASSIVSSAALTSVNRASPAKASMVAPFTGLKSTSAFPVTRKLNNDITSIASNGGRVQCMQVWPPLGKKKFETLSYLPPLSPASLAKEIDYLLRKGWIPCLEFELEIITDKNYGIKLIKRRSSTMECTGSFTVRTTDPLVTTMVATGPCGSSPCFGCTDSSQVLKELEECKKAYPNAFVRIIGFDNKRQVQCISFIAYKPPGV